MKNGDWAERKLLFLIYILIIESKIYSINKLAEKEGKKNLRWFKWFNGKLSMGWTNDQCGGAKTWAFALGLSLIFY